MASLHRDFQSLEVTAGDFCGVVGTPTAGREWGCVTSPLAPRRTDGPNVGKSTAKNLRVSCYETHT